MAIKVTFLPHSQPPKLKKIDSIMINSSLLCIFMESLVKVAQAVYENTVECHLAFSQKVALENDIMFVECCLKTILSLRSS